MGTVVTDVDLAELHSLYPLEKFDAGFTRQQEQFILYYMKGMNPRAAAAAAGYADGNRAYELLKTKKVQLAIDMLREREFSDIRITRERLNGMLLEAHAKAGSSTEEIMAIKELGKMNGLYESDKQSARSNPSVTVNIGDVRNIKQIQQMDDKQLIELAASEFKSLPEATDG